MFKKHIIQERIFMCVFPIMFSRGPWEKTLQGIISLAGRIKEYPSVRSEQHIRGSVFYWIMFKWAMTQNRNAGNIQKGRFASLVMSPEPGRDQGYQLEWNVARLLKRASTFFAFCHHCPWPKVTMPLLRHMHTQTLKKHRAQDSHVRT